MEYSSQGIKLEISNAKDGTFKPLYGLYQVPDMGGTSEKVDVSNFNDTNKRSINSKLVDYGSLEFGFYYNKDSDTAEEQVLNSYSELKSAQIAGESKWFKLTYPDGDSHLWLGGISVKRNSAGVAEALKFTLTTSVESKIEENLAGQAAEQA